MPNLISDNIGEILRGAVVNGEPQPDVKVERDLLGNLLPNESGNAESVALLRNALELITALTARIEQIEARLTANGIT